MLTKPFEPVFQVVVWNMMLLLRHSKTELTQMCIFLDAVACILQYNGLI